MTRFPMHLLAGSLCVGLAAANGWRLHATALAGSAVAAAAVAAAESAPARVVLLAIALCFCGWWWGSTRLDGLDRSLMESYPVERILAHAAWFLSQLPPG